MTIPASAQATPIVAGQFRVPWVDDKGVPTNHARQFFQQMYQFVVSMSRVIPCDASGTNVITLTQLQVAPLVNQYADFDTYAFIAANTSTGTLTAKVVTTRGDSLATIKVFKTNGSAQATTGDVVSGSHYLVTYVHSLDSGNGGFVLR